MLRQKTSDYFLTQLDKINYGALNVDMPNGRSYQFGNVDKQKPTNLKIKDWGVISNLISKGDIGFAEDYRAGLWETDDLASLLTIGLQNEHAMHQAVNGNKLYQMLARFSYMFRRNTISGSKKNITEHYDLGNDFYQLWLDETMTYSSAMFTGPEQDLKQAQIAKYNRIIDRFDTNAPSVLEIGCGWGGFANQCLAQNPNAKIQGVTISDEQYHYARDALGDKVDIIKQDYRFLSGTFDNIVSIEMFEAVGEDYWPIYFAKLKSLMNKNATALVQTITIANDKFESYRKGSDFIRSMIFPGGMLPSPEIFSHVARMKDLKVTDQFEFGHDYARTLEIWLHNFDKKYMDVRRLGYDDKFIRLWRFYLASCIAGFRAGRINVMQAELKHA